MGQNLNLDNIAGIRAWRQRGTGAGSAGTYQVIDYLLAEYARCEGILAVADRAIALSRKKNTPCTVEGFDKIHAEETAIVKDLAAAGKFYRSVEAVRSFARGDG
jgi:hypothetical protein